MSGADAAAGGNAAKQFKTERQYKTDIVKRMKAVGTYRAEFIPTIERLAVLYCQREKLEKDFADSGGDLVIEHTNKFGATNLTKNPYLTARDEVYDQLLAHERELGLTPAALKKMNESALKITKQSSFASALAQALNDAGG